MQDDDIVLNASTEPSIGELIERRLSRRSALAGLGGTALAALAGKTALAQANPSSFTFKEVPHVNDPTHHVADGYDVPCSPARRATIRPG